MAKDVLIIGPEADPQVGAVRAGLDADGVGWRIIDSARWPGAAQLSVAQHATGTRVVWDGEALEAIGAVYVRSLGLDPLYDRYAGELDRRPYGLVNQLSEWRGLVLSALRILEDRGALMVNPTASRAVSFVKPWQLSRLAEAGLPVPETLTTSDPAAARGFVERLGQAVFKPVSGGGYARLLSVDGLDDAQLELISNAPVQFQERFDGDNLRLYVVGGRLVACGRIVSDALDYRTEAHEVEVVAPPADVAEAALRAADALGLRFAGVDVIAEPDRFCILEANASPMFATFDDLAGTSVAGQLARYLADA